VFQGSVQETYIKDSVLNNSDFFMQIVSYMNYEQMSMALINKEIDALIAHRFFYFSEYFHPDFQPTGIILHPTNLYFAFKKNSNPELNNAIDRTLSLLKNEPNSLFYKSLDNLLTRKPDKWIPVYIFVILGLVFFGFMVAGIFVFLLRKIVNRKISELNQQKIELMHAKELAEEGEKRKNAFLQNISHEIRTPMNAIIGFTSFLNNPDLGEEKRATFIGYIQESSHQLLLVLENMITIASLTQKLETPELVPMVVSDELNLFYKEYFSLASQKGLNLLISIKNKNLERKVWADKQKIIQILRSLLNNSIKFTQTGQVSLGCCIIEPYKGVGISENYQLKFFVRDTGIGIKPENLKKVFESFYQADKNVQITYGGAGLGLSIAKEMVALLGGQIWLESQPMVGTTVYFTIPLRFYEDA
jgi:signal transduction histidine kinase